MTIVSPYKVCLLYWLLEVSLSLAAFNCAHVTGTERKEAMGEKVSVLFLFVCLFICFLLLLLCPSFYVIDIAVVIFLVLLYTIEERYLLRF